MALNESVFNPFFRENLLNDCIGKKIIRINRFYNIHQKANLLRVPGKYNIYEEEDLLSLFGKIGNYIELQLSNKKRLNISFSASNNCFNVREAIKCINSDWKNDYSMLYGARQSEMFSHSTSELKDSSPIKTLLGSTIEDVFLLKETDFFAEPYFLRTRSDSKIAGFGFELDRGSILFYKGGFEKILGGWDLKTNSTKEKNKRYDKESHGKKIYGNDIIIDTNEAVIENGIFTKTKEFCRPEKEYMGWYFRSLFHGNSDIKFVLPSYDINVQKTIGIKEVLPDSLIDERMLPLNIRLKYINIKEINLIKKVIKRYEKVDIEKQILFFQELQESFSEIECSLTELQFGLDKELNFNIVKPVDVIPNSLPSDGKPYGNTYSQKKRMLDAIEVFILELKDLLNEGGIHYIA